MSNEDIGKNIGEKVETLQKLRGEIRLLQSKAYDAERDIVKQIIEDGPIHCLRVSYSALARHYYR
jgi:hypothetical protein